MKPIEFHGHNVIFAKNQPEYQPLPAHIDREKSIVTSCWALSYIERLKILLNGKFYLRTMTFNKPLQPILPMVENPLEEYNN